MDDFQLLIDLHKDGVRQGPGGEGETSLAVALSGLKAASNLKIADIGCGTGASTLVLARELDAHIIAVDLAPAFLAELESSAGRAGLDDRISALAAPMDNLPFEDAAYDAIWSEGAAYNMGFAAAVEAWSRFLRPKGIIALSELTWLTDRRPDVLQAHWEREYPEVDTASAKIAVLEQLGFSPIGYFPLPEHCWIENYYRPLQQRFDAFLERNNSSDAARAVVAAEASEIALYEKYKAYVGYGYYIARKVDDV